MLQSGLEPPATPLTAIAITSTYSFSGLSIHHKLMISYIQPTKSGDRVGPTFGVVSKALPCFVSPN